MKKRASVKYVPTEGGGGSENCHILHTNSTDRLGEMRTKGRRGVKKEGIKWISVMSFNALISHGVQKSDFSTVI